MQLHNFFLRKLRLPQIENINLRFFLLDIFENTNDFYKESLKVANINKSLDIQSTIVIGNVGDSVIESDFKTLEHIFLVLFFSLISKKLLDHMEILCEIGNEENKNRAKFTINFVKQKSLIQCKKSSPNEVALFLTDKIFESTNLAEDVFYQKMMENLKKYKIYEIGLNMILLELRQLNCKNFQIQDLSSENHLLTSVSFSLPIQMTTHCNQRKKSINEQETNLLKSNSFKFIQPPPHARTAQTIFILEKISQKILASNMVKSSDHKDGKNSPPVLDNKKRHSEEFLKLKNNEDSQVEDSNVDIHNKQLKFCCQVMKLNINLKNEEFELNGVEERKSAIEGNQNIALLKQKVTS